MTSKQAENAIVKILQFPWEEILMLSHPTTFQVYQYYNTLLIYI